MLYFCNMKFDVFFYIEYGGKNVNIPFLGQF